MNQDGSLNNSAGDAAADEKEAMLAYMAQRAADRAFYLASALESFKQAEHLNEEGLAAFLEIAPNQLTRLALCGRPDVADKANFARDVKAIATKFSIKPLLLAKLLREAAVYETKPASTPASNSFLMAALDREDDEAETGAENDD